MNKLKFKYYKFRKGYTINIGVMRGSDDLYRLFFRFLKYSFTLQYGEEK